MGVKDARWERVPLGTVACGDTRLSLDDAVASAKLASSLRLYGQLRPAVVREVDGGGLVVVKGHRVVEAMRAVGMADVWVVNLGPVDAHEADDVALTLVLGHDVNYAEVARKVTQALDGGTAPLELAARTPFDEQRLGYFRDLCRFDWSQFADDKDSQEAMDWDMAGEDEAPVHKAAEVPDAEREASESLLELDADGSLFGS